MTIDLAELRALLAEATPGPWRDHFYDGHPRVTIGQHYRHIPTRADAALIAAAVNALPALLDRVEALESDLTSACMSAQFATDALCDDRDQLAARVKEFEASIEQIHDAEHQIRLGLSARVAKLEAALRQYGQHDDECDRWVPQSDGGRWLSERSRCTCGLDAALEKP